MQVVPIISQFNHNGSLECLCGRDPTQFEGRAAQILQLKLLRGPAEALQTLIKHHPGHARVMLRAEQIREIHVSSRSGYAIDHQRVSADEGETELCSLKRDKMSL